MCAKLRFPALLVAVLAAACGGSSPSAEPDPVFEETRVAGGAFKGEFELGATVEVGTALSLRGRVEFDGEKRSSTIELGSRFALGIAVRPDIELIARIFGNARNEATGQLEAIFARHALRTNFLSNPGQDVVADANAITTLISYRSEHLRVTHSEFGASFRLRYATRQYENLFGYSFGNAGTAPDLETDDGKRTYLISAGLGQMGSGAGLTAAAILTLISQDGADGKFDGRSCGRPLTDGDFQLPVNSMIALKNAMLNFVESNPNAELPADDTVLAGLCATIDAQLEGEAVCLPVGPRIVSLGDAAIPAGANEATIEVQLDRSQEQLDATTDILDALLVAQEVAFGPGNLSATLTFDTSDIDLGTEEIVPAYLAVRDPATGLADGRLVNIFNTTLPPRVESFSPSRVPLAGGSQIFAHGFFGAGAPAITVGGVAATGVTLHGPSVVSFFTPPLDEPGEKIVTVDGVVIPQRVIYAVQALLDASSRLHLQTLELGWDAQNNAAFGVSTAQVDTDAQDAAFTNFVFNTLDESIVQSSGNTFANDYNQADAFQLGRQVRFGARISFARTQGAPPDGSTLSLAMGAGGQYGTGTIERDDGGIGIGFAVPVSTSAPVVSGKSRFVGLCIRTGDRSTLFGEADFDPDTGRVTVTGLESRRNEAFGDFLVPHFVSLTYQVQANGKMALGGVDPATGITFTDGVVSPDGSMWSLTFAGDGKVGMIIGGRAAEGVVDPSASNYFGAFLHSAPDGADTTSANLAVSASNRPGKPALVCDRCCFLRRPDDDEPIDKHDRIKPVLFFVGPAGTVTDTGGRRIGAVLANGAVLALPGLPLRGIDFEDGFDTDKLGFGLFVPKPALFTSRSMRCNYNVLAKGIELRPDGDPEPNPFLAHTMLLGVARPEGPGGVTVAGVADFPLAAKFAFETVKRKVITRDDEREVTVERLDPATDEGLGYAFLNNTLVAFCCPLPEGGTFQVFKGGIDGDGEVGSIQSNERFGSVWCGFLAKEAASPPAITGDYDVRYCALQAVTEDNPPSIAAGDVFSIKGTGTWSYTGSTFVRNTSQISFNEACTQFDDPANVSGPFNGTFTISPLGRYTQVTDFGGGFTSFDCGFATRDGCMIVWMNPGPGPLNTFFVATRKRDTTSVARTTAPFCGLALDFDGLGGITATLRDGRISLGSTTSDMLIRRVTYNNRTPGFAVSTEFAFGLPTTFPGTRAYEVEFGATRRTDGDVCDPPRRLGAQAEFGPGSPKGNLDLTGPWRDR